MTTRGHRVRWISLAAVASLGLVMAVTGCLPGSHRSSSVTVMTRNLYLGADITRPIRAARGETGEAALVALAHADAELRDVVHRTDFATRSRLLAKEIAAADPDLVGLQEVALWRHGPLQIDQIGQPNATVVDEDFLQLLRTALADRQLAYDVVRVQRESDVEAPAFTGPLTQPQSAEDVRLTVSDAILVRHGSRVTVQGSGSGQFRSRLDAGLPGLALSFVRGYVWADVSSGDSRFRFVTTHLESQSADVALAQSQELLAGPAAAAQHPTIVVCDCNSNPDDATVRPGDTVPRSAAYQRITTGGFVDQWLQLDPARPGYTSGLSELVDNTTATGFRRRLDLVLARGTAADPVRAVHGEIVGNQLSDRDPATGLWPSDHAGVVVELQVG